MNNTVFNSTLQLYCLRYLAKISPVPDGEEFDPRWQRAKMIALIFEQLMLFDKLAIEIDRTGISLVFLIQELGLNELEELMEKGVVKLVLWTPLIFTSKGKQKADGTFDEDAIMGTPPLVAANYVEEDLDPNKSLDSALKWFTLHNDRKRIFKRIASKTYVYPDGEDKSLADNAVKLTIDAYQQNYLSPLGLPMSKDPGYLSFEERQILSRLSLDVLDTSILSRLQYSSYEQYNSLLIASESIRTIESGLKVSTDTSEILTMENMPNIQSLIYQGVFKLKDIIWLRDRSTVEHYRNWINGLSKSDNHEKISLEFINAITGKAKFFENAKGKLLRSVGMYFLGGGLGTMIAGPLGGVIGLGAARVATDLGLSLFDTFTLDSVLKGWNPRMFTTDLKNLADKERSDNKKV
jgi:hypothetical protein